MEMSNFNRSDFFVVNRWILKLGALWRPDSKNPVVIVLFEIYGTTTFLFVNIFFTLTEFLSLLKTYGNEYDIIKNISFALTHLLGAFKVLFFHYNEARLKKIMSALEHSLNRYETSTQQDFDPPLIYEKYKKIGIIYSLAFLLLAHATLISSYVPPAISAISVLTQGKNETVYLPKKLPYFCWMPFQYDTANKYLVALGYQSVPMFSYAYSIVGMDTLFMNIMNCVTMNLEIIQGAFITLNERINKRPHVIRSKNFMRHPVQIKEQNFEMKKICQHLQIVYKTCDELENIYKYLNLAQSLATLFILCTCLYLVSTTPINSKQFYAEIIYMIAMGFQLILYCSFGNEITLKAAEIPSKIWQNDWLSTNKDFKKAMIVTMARSKKPLYLTAGKFVPLTLSTFLTIIKASYSFYAVLKSTNK